MVPVNKGRAKDVQHEIVLYIRNVNEDDPFSIELAGENLPYNKYCIPRVPGGPYVYECVTNGKGYIEADGAKHLVQAGDFYMISEYSNLEYYSDPDEPYSKVYINCRGALNKALCQIYNLNYPYFIYHFPKAEEYIRSMHGILCNPDLDLNTINETCGVILHRMLSDLYTKIRSGKRNHRDDLAYRIRAFLDQRICEKVTLDDLVETFFISKAQLIDVFKKNFEVSPYQYLISQRIDMACSLLKTSSLSVREISEMLQFADPHYFSTFFRSRVGCSPSEYRKK